MGGEDSGDDDYVSGSEEAGGRNMAWLTKEGNEQQADVDDVDIPNLPPIEDSQFEAEGEDPEKDNDEAEILDVDDENRSGDSSGKVIEGTTLTAVAVAPRDNMATGSMNITN